MIIIKHFGTYRKSFSDRNFNIKDEDSGSETSASSNGVFGTTKYAANTVTKEKKRGVPLKPGTK